MENGTLITGLLDYGIAGILVFTLVAWFLERREVLKRFENLLKESAAADIKVAQSLEAVTTTIQLWTSRREQ